MEKGLLNMKKRICGLWAIVVCICIMFCGICVEASEDKNIWVGMESELLENSLESENIWQNVARRGTYLQSGHAKISNEGNRVVKISGGTDAYQTCDRVSTTIYLDRYENGKWVEVTSVSKSVTNAYTSNCSKNVSVTGGYYYRARGYHTVNEGNTTESAPSLSDGIWIG